MAKLVIEPQPPEQYQVEDIASLTKLVNSANWSEMGAKKTSTGLWMFEQLAELDTVQNPKILIVTTRSGKGTFFQLAPILLPNWQLYNADLKGISTFMNGIELKLPIESLGDTFKMPIIVVSHYHVFLKANRGIPETYSEADGDPKDLWGYPKEDADGHIIFKPLTQADYLMDIKWDGVWLDEAHRIKDRKNKWRKNLGKTKRTHSHVSTGTGFINRPNEIWSLLSFLAKSVTFEFNGELKTVKLTNYWAFVEEYCLEEISESGYRKVTGVKPEKVDEFRALVRSFGPRRELDEVMPHIKKPIPIRRDVELNAIQRKMYNAIVQDLETLDENGTPFQVPTVLAALQRLRQVAVATPEVVEDYFDSYKQKRVIKIKLVEPSSKLDDFMEILEELAWDDESKQQVVLFSNFKDPLYLLEERFKAQYNKKGELVREAIPYIHLKQSDNDAERYNKWAVEWPKKEHRVFMSTVSLGGESINLTSAQHIVFLDRSWSPKDNMQAIGRVRRPGQEGQPVVINIEAEDTTDQYVESVNIQKNGWFRQIFSNVEPINEDSVDINELEMDEEDRMMGYND